MLTVDHTTKRLALMHELLQELEGDVKIIRHYISDNSINIFFSLKKAKHNLVYDFGDKKPVMQFWTKKGNVINKIDYVLDVEHDKRFIKV